MCMCVCLHASVRVSVSFNIQPMTTREEMCSPSNSDEMLAVLSRIKVWKAACSNGLLPDIVECCGGPLLDLIASLFGTVWSEKQIPVEWCDCNFSASLSER